jgi:tol-pal system protein YbgF
MKPALALITAAVSTVAFSATVLAAPANQPGPQAGLSLLMPIAQAGAAPVVLFAQAGSSNNDALMLLLDQFQSLRSEMEAMRGMVEEHSFEIRRMQRDSLDRYTDLDSRISALYGELESGGAASTAAPAPISTPPSTAVAPAASSPAPVTSSPSSAPLMTDSSGIAINAGGNLASGSIGQGTAAVMLTEQQLYELALDSLLQREEYQNSIQQFDQYLAQYPDGRFVTNAHYWKGQAFVNLSMLDQARESFEIIITQYPDGRKIEDAMYSLGTVYHRLGDITRARQLLQDVRARFPNTSAANLADIYLRTI